MKHPDADLIMQAAQIRANGECEHWEYRFTPLGVEWFDVDINLPLNSDLHNWEIRMKPSHPDFNTDKNPNRPKPVLKQIDMSKLPVGTMTNYGEIVAVAGNMIRTFDLIRGSFTMWNEGIADLRLAEQTKPTAWLGGECPVPEGCKYKAIRRDNSIHNYTSFTQLFNYERDSRIQDYDIIAYCITGVADGWTDGSL
jgi:hypothetical protein